MTDSTANIYEVVPPGSESPAPARNPSPPREVIGLNDNIGKTSFSKHWVFGTLMKLIQVIEDPKESKGNESENKSPNVPEQTTTTSDDPSKSSSGDKSDSINSDEVEGEKTRSNKESITTKDHHVIDISNELQDELCQLWDMSSDEDVAKLLEEFKAVELLTEVVSKSDAPRATEIAIGILGNMACTRVVCDSMASRDSLIKLSLCLLSNSDAPTLVELTRFLFTVLSNKKCQSVWIKAWSGEAGCINDLIFILKSSVNKDLLRNTAELLACLLDLSDDLCTRWSSPELLVAIIEAIRQLGLSIEEGACDLLHCLQLMSTQSTGVSAIVEHVEITTDVLLDFLLKVCEDEIVILEGNRAAGIAAALSVINISLMSSPAGYSLMYSTEKCIRCILKITYACDKELVILGTPKNSPNQSRGNSESIKSLKEVLYNLLYDTMSMMNKEEVDASQTEEKESPNEATTPSILKYMDKECERPRLFSTISLVSSHESGHLLLDNIIALCDKYNLNRLRTIVIDYSGRSGDNSESYSSSP